MEASLSQTFSASRGSAEDFLLFCIPCNRDGVRVSAKGYCTTCKEHLCEACYQHHRKPAPVRHHVLLDQDSMPTTPSKPNSQDDFDNCADHGDEKLKFYCREHDKIVCSICVTLHHRVCKVEYIPTLSKHIQDGELNELLAEMKALEKNCESWMKKARDEMKVVTHNHEEIIREIHQSRKEINAHLDKMESHLVKEAENMFDNQQMTLRKLSKDVEDIKEEMTKKQAYLDNLIQNNCINKLFVEMKESKKRLEELKKKEKQHRKETNIQIVRFIKNYALVNIFEKQKHLGGLVSMNLSEAVLTEKTLNLNVVDDIRMNSSGWFDRESDIIGMAVIQTDKIVICDSKNKKVKYYDTVQKRIISEIKLNEAPRNVAAITDSKFVVTVPANRRINFMSLTNGCISSDNEVNIYEKCYGIAYGGDKIFVSCCRRILVLNPHGKIMQRLIQDEWLSYGSGIAVNTTGTAIYVSAYLSVIQIDWQRKNVINTCKPTRGGSIRGICGLNDGTFLVCSDQEGEDKLLRLSNGCTCKIMREEKLDSWYPGAMAYCKTTRKLFVSYAKDTWYESKNHLTIFKVDWS